MPIASRGIAALCIALPLLLAACATAPSAPAPVEILQSAQVDTARRTFLILQVDDSGLEAPSPTPLLAEIERSLARRADPNTRTLKTAFSLCVGSGAGAIAAGMTAAGVPAGKIVSYHEKTLPTLLAGPGKARFSLGPKYRRDRFQAELFEVLQTDCGCGYLTLNDLYSAPLLLIPAYDQRSDRTHLFRTRDPGNIPLEYNSDLELVQVISAAAFSDPKAFGAFSLPKVTWDQKSPTGALIRKHGAKYRDSAQDAHQTAAVLTAPGGILTAWAHQVRATDQIVLISIGSPQPDHESSNLRAALIATLKKRTSHITVQRFTSQTPEFEALSKALRTLPLVPATPVPIRSLIIKPDTAKPSL